MKILDTFRFQQSPCFTNNFKFLFFTVFNVLPIYHDSFRRFFRQILSIATPLTDNFGSLCLQKTNISSVVTTSVHVFLFSILQCDISMLHNISSLCVIVVPMSFAKVESSKGFKFRFRCSPGLQLADNCFPYLQIHLFLASLLLYQIIWYQLRFSDSLRFHIDSRSSFFLLNTLHFNNFTFFHFQLLVCAGLGPWRRTYLVFSALFPSSIYYLKKFCLTSSTSLSWRTLSRSNSFPVLFPTLHSNSLMWFEEVA